MKKIVFLLFFTFFAYFLEAVPCKNTAFPKIIEEGFIFSSANSFSLRVGYEGNFVYDKRLRIKNASHNIDNFKFYVNSGELTLNLLNRLDVFATYGIGKMDMRWIIEEMKNVYYKLELESDSSRSWSVGTKIIFLEWGNTCLSLGGRYFFFDPKILWITKASDSYDISNKKLKFKEWQIDLGISYNIDIFTPYVCVKYANAKSSLFIEDIYINSNLENHLKMKNENNFGLSLGITLSCKKYFMLNLETRLIDEEAFTIQGEVKF